MSAPDILIYTDLDGTLLNHHDYGFDAAIPLLRALETAGIPVIPATSKTRLEMQAWRRLADNSHPMIVENGAAVLIPESYFSVLDDALIKADGYHSMIFVSPRAHWQNLLAEASSRFPGCWRSFAELGEEGVAELTGLEPEEAALSSCREYGEPVAWQGSEDSLSRFRDWMHDHGANVLLGGRFVHISGRCDKGKALTWLTGLYRRQPGAGTIRTIALGDSNNDLAMLHAADQAVVVRSPVHPPPVQAVAEGEEEIRQIPVTKNTAPSGWVEGALAALTELRPELASSLEHQIRLPSN